MTFIRTFAALSTALFLLAGFALAQSTGTVQGIVKDPSGGMVPGAVVILTNDATHQKTQAITTTAGAYSFAFLPPGVYSLTADHSGFNRFLRDSITVDIAGVTVVDVALQVGATGPE